MILRSLTASLFVLSIGFAMCSQLAFAGAGETAESLCEAEYVRISKLGAKVSAREKIAQFSRMAPQCGNSGLYYYRLALWYIEARDFEGARSIANEGISKNRSYAFEIRCLIAGSYYHEGKLDLAEQEAAKLARERPDVFLPYTVMLDVATKRSDFEQMIEQGEKVRRLMPTLISPYAQLTLAYFKKKQYEKAVDAYKDGLRQPGSEKTLLEGPAAIAAMYSHAELQQYRQVRKLLDMRYELVPESKSDPAIVRVDSFIRSKGH